MKIETLLTSLSILLCVSCNCFDNRTSYVNPFIGTAYTGHTFPGAALPFGFAQPGPQTGNLNWKYCSGYNYEDTEILGFSQNHLNGTGCPDLGDILVLPLGDSNDSHLSSTIDKNNELAYPGYYKVSLKNNDISAEMTCTEHVAFYHFAFKRGRKLYIDFQNGMVTSQNKLDSRVQACEINVEDDYTISGHMNVNVWVKDRDLYFVIKFNSPFTIDKKWYEKPAHKAPKYILNFGNYNRNLLMKISLSTKSLSGAKHNLEAEVEGWNFNRIKKAAQKKWEKVLSVISINGTEDQKVTTYTSLYHLCLQPNIISDKGEIEEYSTFSLWDTYRAAHPLYSLLFPDMNLKFVSSMLSQYDRQGFLPIWALSGKENYCMIGNHSIPVIVEAVLNDSTDTVDKERAYKAIYTSLTKDHKKSEWKIYDEYGYYPFDIISKESVSRTLESCYDDWCAHLLARSLNKTQDSDYFLKRSMYYKNLFDSASGLMRGKDSNGNWRQNFNPFELAHASIRGGDYTEGNAWQYSWHCMHDINGLIDLMGGKEKFVSKLDSLFTLEYIENLNSNVPDVTGLIGQYAHGNEPSHHIPYLYTLAGRPDRTADTIRKIFDQYYQNKPDGLCGNDDCGQMSAWYLFSAMGFYPVDPVSDNYVIGAPQIKEISLNLQNHKTLRIKAQNLSSQNKYVSSVTFNGETIKESIRKAQLMEGGELIFYMSNFRD